MRISKLLGGLLALGIAASSHAGHLVLDEGFDDVPGLGGAGWVVTNNSSPVGSTSWFQGNAGIFSAASGAANSYAAANFNSAATGGAISTWLISPTLTFFGGAELGFDLRLLGEGLLDTVEVYFSANGSSTDVGSTATSTGDFALLASFSSDTDTDWVSHLLSIGGPGANSGRFAFRYVAPDNLNFADYVGLDNVTLRVPEPATMALVAIALLGASAARRRA